MVSAAFTGGVLVVLSIYDLCDCFERRFLWCLDSFESVDNVLKVEGWMNGQF